MSTIGRVLDRCREDLKVVERDTAKLERVTAPFPRLHYNDAVKILKDAGRESPDALRRVHALKTGRLMSCAVHCALVLARPAPAVDQALRQFARELGLLFQIVDDILDVEGSEADLGKAVGADARQGTITYVSAHGLEEARRLAGEAHARALHSLSSIPGPTDDLVGITDLTFMRQH